MNHSPFGRVGPSGPERVNTLGRELRLLAASKPSPVAVATGEGSFANEFPACELGRRGSRRAFPRMARQEPRPPETPNREHFHQSAATRSRWSLALQGRF